ncbi:4383_t:CDS:2 [Entrophospora sp. SA101]|nr:4383_t:CDS:2 [Entrophospora sp. SA101]
MPTTITLIPYKHKIYTVNNADGVQNKRGDSGGNEDGGSEAML